MKRLFIIAGLLACSLNFAAAQNIVNGDFAVNNGNDGVLCGIWNTFSDASVPNWVRSHGTPNFQVLGAGATNNHVVLWSGGIGSEGILGNYQFKKSKAYCVKVLLDSWQGDVSDHFYVYACSNLVRNLNLLGDCTSNMPSLPGGAELIGIGSQQSINNFPYTPVGDNQQIFIAFFTSTGTWDFVAISEVIITSFCRETLFFNSGQIPPDIYFANYITAGTSVIGTTPVTNNPAAITELNGASSVILLPNFSATMSNAGYFLADIKPCFPIQCSSIASKPDKQGDTGFTSSIEKTSQSLNLKESITNMQKDMVTISPNPNNGSFVIMFPPNTFCKVSIIDMMGITIFKTTISGEMRKEIQLNDNVLNGTYMIQITGNNFSSSKKLVISR